MLLIIYFSLFVFLVASRGNFSTNVATVIAGLATSEKGDSKGAQLTPEQKAESLRYMITNKE